MPGMYEPSEKASSQCGLCGEVFGTGHADGCPVKFRDTTNPDPAVQRAHENLDRFYDEADAAGGLDGLSVKRVDPPLSADYRGDVRELVDRALLEPSGDNLERMRVLALRILAGQ